MPQAICPACRARCRVDLKQIGRKVICPKCDTKFTAAAAGRSRKPVKAGAGVLVAAVVVLVVVISSSKRSPVAEAPKVTSAPVADSPVVPASLDLPAPDPFPFPEATLVAPP